VVPFGPVSRNIGAEPLPAGSAGPTTETDDVTAHRRPRAATLVGLCAVLLLLTAACGDDSPAAQPVMPTATITAPASASPSPSRSPSPSPSPSPEPLSPFEADPAVIALRTFVLEAANAVNAGNLALPALNAVSTPNRQDESRRSFASDLGGYAPGPYPFTPLDVQVVSPTERRIPLCTVETGWALTAPGGTPREPRAIGPGLATVKLVDAVWKVDSIVDNKGLSCTNVTLPMPEFP